MAKQNDIVVLYLTCGWLIWKRDASRHAVALHSWSLQLITKKGALGVMGVSFLFSLSATTWEGEGMPGREWGRKGTAEYIE
jgi:hypothetical protein